MQIHKLQHVRAGGDAGCEYRVAAGSMQSSGWVRLTLPSQGCPTLGVAINRSLALPKKARMRISIPLISLALIAGCAAPNQAAKTIDPQGLIGVWKVDLRPTPSAPAYFQEFVVTSVKGKTFAGTFYGAPIEQARVNTDWGMVRIAFVTSDLSGPYNHSAVLSGNQLGGLTNSTGRDFLSYWSATKP